MLIKSRILLLGTVSLLALSACNTKETPKTAAPAQGAVAATVNGVAIPVSRVDLMVKQSAAQGQPDSPELRKMIIDNLAMQFIISEEAVKKGMDKTPETLDQIELIKQSILANAFIQDYIKNNPVTDAMIKAEYAKITAQSNEYKARHILVAKEADAQEIIAKLKKDPKIFDALALKQSMDPGSKDKGGDLGWFDPQAMVPEFGAALAKLEKGKFTEVPVKTQFGYHVILLEDSRAKQVPPLEQVKEQLTQQVQQQNLKKYIEDMKAKAKIDIVAAPVTTTTVSATTTTTTVPSAAPATK